MNLHSDIMHFEENGQVRLSETSMRSKNNEMPYSHRFSAQRMIQFGNFINNRMRIETSLFLSFHLMRWKWSFYWLFRVRSWSFSQMGYSIHIVIPICVFLHCIDVVGLILHRFRHCSIASFLSRSCSRFVQFSRHFTTRCRVAQHSGG